MRYLVTGASGLIGWHLVDRLARGGHHVTAWMRNPADLWKYPRVSIEKVDLLRREDVAERLTTSAPQVVVHLAAQSLPKRSWDAPIETMHVNLDSTLNLLEAIRGQETNRPRFLLPGTSARYAVSKDGNPISEDAPVNPSSPYAVSKNAAEEAVGLYARAFQIEALCFRPFLWIGPRKTGDVASDIARRIVAIERGAKPSILIGRTDVVRDFIDVRDGIEALLILASAGEAGEAYNICGGTGLSIRGLLDAFRAETKTAFETVADPALMRPVDELVRIGDPTRMHALGWSPKISLQATVRAILNYWRVQPA